MSGDDFDSLTGGDVPYLDVALGIVTAGGEEPSIGREGDRVHVLAAVLERLQHFPRLPIPDAGHAVPAAGGKAFPALIDGDGFQRRLRIERPLALRAEVHQATPLPVAEFRLAGLQHFPRGIERILVDLGSGEADLGDVGFVLFLLLREFGLLPFRHGDLLGCDRRHFGHLLLLGRFHSGELGLLLQLLRSLGLHAFGDGDLPLSLRRLTLPDRLLLRSQGEYLGLLFFLSRGDGFRLFVEGHDLGFGGAGGLLDRDLFGLGRALRLGHGQLLLLANPHGRTAHNDEDRRHQPNRRPLEEHQTLLTRHAILLAVNQLLSQLGMLRLLGVEQRQAEVEVPFPPGTLRVRQLGLPDPDSGPLVSRPKFVSLLKPEQGARVMLVVVGLLGVFQVIFRPRGEQHAFRVRLIVANRGLQRLHIRVAIFRIGGHRLHRNVDQLALFVGRRDLVAGRRHQALHHVLRDVRRPIGEDLVQDRPEQVDVAGRTDLVDRSGRHLGGHVRGRATHRGHVGDAARLAKPLQRMGQSPVHHQHFAELAEHDVLGLEVAMHDPPRMRKADGIRRPHQNVEVLGQRFLADDLLPGSPLHLLHRIEQVPLRVRTHIVNRHDVRVIQIAGHHHFRQELGLLLVVGGRSPLDHFEGHAAIDRGLPGIVHDPHAPLAQDFDQFVFGIAALVDVLGKVFCIRQGFGLDDQRLLGRLTLTGLSGLHRHMGLSARLVPLVAPDRLNRFYDRFGNVVRDKGLGRVATRRCTRIHRVIDVRPHSLFGGEELDIADRLVRAVRVFLHRKIMRGHRRRGIVSEVVRDERLFGTGGPFRIHDCWLRIERPCGVRFGR